MRSRSATSRREAKKFTVIMNAATSIITTKSPYMARTSVTMPMLNQTLGTWAATKGGVKKVFTMVSDYGPGHDAEGAFHLGFKEAGGEIIGSVRFPVANPDFSAFVQRAKDINPEASTSGFRAARSRPRSPRRCSSAASIRRRRRSWARTWSATMRCSRASATRALGIITVVALRLQSRLRDEQGLRGRLHARSPAAATRISSRSAAMTACT